LGSRCQNALAAPASLPARHLADLGLAFTLFLAVLGFELSHLSCVSALCPLVTGFE
jgi:hypothetical protein